jgi:hypothetical protein
LGFTDVSEKPSFFFTVPARNPRTLCCCQSVACIISAMLAPLGWLRQCEHALLLGDPLDLWLVNFHRCFGGGDSLGL